MSSLNLYKFTGDKKQLRKSDNWTLIETISGNWRQDTDILKPVFDISPTNTSTIAKLTKETNYVYVADFGRYYYVDDIICKAGNIIELYLSVDVLMSWGTEILALSEGIVSRNSEADNSNIYLDDSELHIYNNPNIQTYAFNYANGSPTFGGQEFILAVAGG